MADDPVGADPPLSTAELDLARVAVRLAPDEFLLDLLELADHREGGMGFGVGLLVNGMIVMGQLTSREEIAKHSDDEYRTLIERVPKPENVSTEEWSKIRERFSTMASTAVVQLRDEHSKLDEDLRQQVGEDDWDIRSVPGSLARRLVSASARSHLTLLGARIFAPGQAGVTQVPVMRVQLSQIAGWWLLRTNEAGDSKFALWEKDVPGVSRDEQ
jgi:hypothetical protein